LHFWWHFGDHKKEINNMKRWIVFCSVTSSIAFAIALANADDMSNTVNNAEKQAMSDASKTMKSCVDENGVTYNKGEKGFSKCMEKMHKKEQGGTVGSESQPQSQDSTSGKTTTPPSDSSES
jgi:hypothetical protein